MDCDLLATVATDAATLPSDARYFVVGLILATARTDDERAFVD